MIESLIYLVIFLVLLGVALWVIDVYFVPIPQPVKVAVVVIVVLVGLLYLLGAVPGRWGRVP